MTIKKLTIPCDFGGKKAQVNFYIGQPEEKHHPLGFQVKWLSDARGGVVPSSVMENLSKLHEIAKRNNVPFAELCEYALTASIAPEAKEISGVDNAKAAAESADKEEGPR